MFHIGLKVGGMRRVVGADWYADIGGWSGIAASRLTTITASGA